jgi:HSP20 family molecular chaperone IbpA
MSRGEGRGHPVLVPESVRDRPGQNARQMRRAISWRMQTKRVARTVDAKERETALYGGHMKKHDFPDMREILDEIFGAAEDFKNAFTSEFHDFSKRTFVWTDQRDYYPGYSYPPVNVYMKENKAMVLQFALAGFSESDVSLEFKGDYLIFSAQAPADFEPEETVRYFKRRLKLKDIKDQRYYVPADKYHQDKVDAVLRNSILTVTIPARDDVQEEEGVKVDIKAEKAKPASKSKIKDE